MCTSQPLKNGFTYLLAEIDFVAKELTLRLVLCLDPESVLLVSLEITFSKFLAA
jgi:hypothetical protein